MLRLRISLLLLFANLVAFGQSGKQLLLGTRDSIYSRVLGEQRTLLVHLPESAPDGYAPRQKYPVVYVLDGESFFYSVVALSESMGGGSGNFSFPKLIVVGVVNTDRTRDLTPTHSTDSTVQPAFLLANSGGGPAFMQFLEKEAIPYIDSLYPAAPYRVLMGHSFGGLTVLGAVMRSNGPFAAGIAMDPSLWWDRLNYLQSIKKSIAGQGLHNKSLYVGIAHSFPARMSVATAKRDRTVATLPARAIFDFDDWMRAHAPAGFNYRSRFFSEYDHGSVPLVAAYDALPYSFRFFGLNFPMPGFFQPGYKHDDTLQRHYEAVSTRLGYTVYPPGELVNAIAQQLQDMQQSDRALRYLRLNEMNYPNSTLPYEALAAYYERSGDKAQAQYYLQRALHVRNSLPQR